MIITSLLFAASGAAHAFPAHDNPHRAGNTAPDDAAVVIGIEDYFALPDVPFAERDAQAVSDLLVYTLGVPGDRVEQMGKDASKERILAAVGRARERAGSQGTVWLYFAGHGAASPVDGERMLLGVDTMADAASFEARSVRLDELEAATKGAARVVLIADACYAGAGRDGGELLPGKRFAVPTYATQPSGSWIEWNAAQPNELSGPLDAARHGAFTWAVVGALRGWADGQLDGARDGVITFDEADLYVQEVLRGMDVRDQRPALVVSDRAQVAVRLSDGKAEARPDTAALKAQAATVAAATPAPPEIAPAVPMAQPVVWREVKCKPMREPLASLPPTHIAAEPGVDPRATWSCKGGSIYVNRFPPVPGRTAMQAMVTNLATDRSAIPQKAPIKVEVVVGKGYGDESSIDVNDPTTWPAIPLQTPRGELVARLAPFERKLPMYSVPAPLMVVEDDRQPGALLVCRRVAGNLTPWGPLVDHCTEVLEGALESDTPELGAVR